MIGRWLEKRIEARVEARVRAAVEERAGYSDLLLAGLEATASGSAGNVLRTSALETAARIWSGALASASVSGGRGALTPAVLALTGRQLVRAGEAVFAIRVRGASVSLDPVAEWEVMEGWRYRAEILEPPGRSVTRYLPRAAVIHWRWATDPREPWRGVSPMAAASLGAGVAANVETRLGEEATAPTAILLPVPQDGGGPGLDGLRDDIAKAKGSAVLAETTAAGWEEGRQAAGTLGDWDPKRLGPMIPEQLRQLHEDALQRVLAVCGIPGSLASVGADGTQLREDYRRFVMLAVQPLAVQLAAEAAAKLGPVAFGFHGLHGHDIQGRATAYARLRDAGVEDAEARRLAGLE